VDNLGDESNHKDYCKKCFREYQDTSEEKA